MWWASCSRDYFDPMGTHLTTLGPLLWGAMVVRAPKDWGFEHYPQVMGAVPGISRNPAQNGQADEDFSLSDEVLC